MVKYNCYYCYNNQGVGIIRGGVLGEIENSNFLTGKRGSLTYLYEQ